MPDQDDDLPFGLYERLLTTGLKARLLRFDPSKARAVTGELDAAEAHATLARHVEAVIARALIDLPKDQQVAVTNELIGLLVATNIPAGDGLHEDLVASPTALLRAIHLVTGAPTDDRDIVAPWSHCRRPICWSTPAASRPSPTRSRTKSHPPTPST